MQIRRAVHGASAVADRRPDVATARLPRMPGALAVLLALAIAAWAFVDGDQPIVADAQGYYDFGKLIATVGPKAFASELRTYGYPAFLAGLMRVVGHDPEDVRAAAFAVQLALLIGAAWIGARRVGGALGIGGIGRVLFVITVANPFLLMHSVQLLTDLPAAVLAYLAVVLSLPQRRPESAARVTCLAAAALSCAGLAVMLRPSSLVVAPVLVGIWVARAVVFRDVHWTALPVALLAFVLPFVPQAWSNYRAFGVAHPLIVSNLYGDHLLWGLMYLKYATFATPEGTSPLYYDNPFRPPDGLTVGEVLRQHPGAYVATLAIHAFTVVDQDLPFTFVLDVDPWYRWPLSVLNYVFFLGAFVGLALGLRRTARQPGHLLRRQRFALLAFGVAALALWAIYLPTAVECRYGLPLYLLLAPPFALAAGRVYAALPTVGSGRVALGTLAVAAWVGLAAAASVWVQNQSPSIVALRGGSGGPVTAASRAATEAAIPAPQPPPPAGPTVVPRATPEIPSARYVAELPRELTVSSGTELDVTVTNTGREAWTVGGPYPVHVSARFIAQKTELHDQVKGLMKESQVAALPGDVGPGASATVRLRLLAPPMPGRYTLVVHVTRLGVPDSPTNVQRVIRVVV